VCGAGRRTLSAGVERREPRRDGHGAAIVVPVRRSVVALVLLGVLQIVAVGSPVGEQAGAAALVACEAEELVEGLAVHVVGRGRGEGGADERRDGEVEGVGGVHGAAAKLAGMDGGFPLMRRAAPPDARGGRALYDSRGGGSLAGSLLGGARSFRRRISLWTFALSTLPWNLFNLTLFIHSPAIFFWKKREEKLE
jgi:hypothetical protein